MRGIPPREGWVVGCGGLSCIRAVSQTGQAGALGLDGRVQLHR